MTICLGKSCSFGLPLVPFVKLLPFYLFSYFPFGFVGSIWDLIVSVRDHCLYFYFIRLVKRLLISLLYLSCVVFVKHGRIYSALLGRHGFNLFIKMFIMTRFGIYHGSGYLRLIFL